MPNKKSDHEVHKYYRTEFSNSGTTIYRCGLPGCPHFVYEPLVIGRFSVCWRCGNDFIINKKTIRNRKLHCEECTKGKEQVRKDVPKLIDEFIKGLGSMSESD